MNGVRRVLTGRVGRHVFLLFVLSAFVPFALIAVLSYVQVRQLHLQSGQQRLAVASKQYGLAVYERLLSAEEVARNIADFPGEPRHGRRLAEPRFRAIGLVDAQGHASPLLGTTAVPRFDAAARARLAQGKARVWVVSGESAARVFLFVPASAGAMIVGELDPDYLWGDSSLLPAATDVCVIAETLHAVLHCSAPMPEKVLSGILGSPSEYAFKSFAWNTVEGKAQRSVVWAEFMGAEFGTGDWLYVLSQSEAYQLGFASELDKFFLPVALLALLVAALLSLRQIRTILVPVQQLALGARRVAQRDFAARVDVRSNDEFGELARAFNTMSERLGRQFAVLAALAEIDRMILSTPETEQVIRLVIERAGSLLSADSVSVTLLDPDNADLARTYFLQGRDGDDAVSMTRQHLAVRDRRALQASPEFAWAPLAAEERAYLAPLRDAGMGTAYVQSIVWRGAVCGVLALGYRRAPAIGDEDRKHMSDFADRVAVAISSAWRDEQLYQQAHFDALTGLPNRSLLKDRVNREIARCQRADATFALLFIDLDHFKNVNDTLGHSFGDRVLRETAGRISRCLRASDTVSRLGGDEFVVILSQPQHTWDASAIGEHVVRELSEAFVIDDQSCFLSASVGVALFPRDGTSAETLIRNADSAMYRAKADGRAQVVYFEEEQNAKTVERVSIDRELRRAIERGEMELQYQPQFDLATDEIEGAEALLRWRHPGFGMVPPAQFVPIAEEFGYVEQIGEWVLREACTQLKAWRAQGLPLKRLAVNVSPRQFRTERLLSVVRDCTRQAGVPPGLLEVEITEGVLAEQHGNAERMLRELAAMGVEVALDDFGTGFSSMAYLKRFPVHKIKIDRVFIEGLGRDKDSQAIVASIIAMSHALSKIVVAEGVETATQAAILRKLRCDQAQGFHLSYPLSADQFAELVKVRRRAA